MAKLFCMKCNGSTDYSSSKPQFCSKCGKPFIDSEASYIPKPTFTPTIQQSAPQSRPSQNRGRLNRPVEDEYIEHPEDATECPQIDKIECEFTIDNLRPNRQTGKDVFTSGSASEAAEVLGKKPIKASKNSKINKQQLKQTIQEQFMSELAPKRGQQRESTEITG